VTAVQPAPEEGRAPLRVGFRRLAVFFAAVYFVQGFAEPKAGLAAQPIFFLLKDELKLSAAQTATFLALVGIAWNVKPLYGLTSDLVPLFGYRRRSYLLVTTAMATLGWLSLGLLPGYPYGLTLLILGLTGLGLAFTDVLTDAMMVENGRPRGLTGAFQSVQWACITVASVLVGVLGGYLAETRSLRVAFFLAACFPLISLMMGVFFVRETPTRADRAAFGETWLAIRATLGAREIWLVAGFIFFFWFSPSFGPAFLYYQTDTLKFSQQFIGHLAAIGSLSAVVGAVVYAPLSRRVPLKRIMNLSIGFGVAGTLAYLLYRGTISAVIITVSFGSISMIMQLAFLDLAAKACPRHVEATFFALLMSVFNLGVQLSENVGARLYDVVGYEPLVYIAAAMTAITWFLVPLVRIDRIEAKARAEAIGPQELASVSPPDPRAAAE